MVGLLHCTEIQKQQTPDQPSWDLIESYVAVAITGPLQLRRVTWSVSNSCKLQQQQQQQRQTTAAAANYSSSSSKLQQQQQEQQQQQGAPCQKEV